MPRINKQRNTYQNNGEYSRLAWRYGWGICSNSNNFVFIEIWGSENENRT